MLKNVRSSLYLHVPAEHTAPRDPVVQWTSTTEGSRWKVERLSGAGCAVMLKSTRSGLYLHVPAEHTQPRDQVVQWSSTTEGSQWQIERVGFLGSTMLLKSVRSGLYLHVPAEHVQPRDPVVQWTSTTEGSQWEVQVGAATQLRGSVIVAEATVAPGNSSSAARAAARGAVASSVVRPTQESADARQSVGEVTRESAVVEASVAPDGA